MSTWTVTMSGTGIENSETLRVIQGFSTLLGFWGLLLVQIMLECMETSTTSLPWRGKGQSESIRAYRCSPLTAHVTLKPST